MSAEAITQSDVVETKQPDNLAFHHQVGNVSVSIFLNKTRDGSREYYSVKIAKRYQPDPMGQPTVWQDRNSYSGLGDVARLTEAAALATQWLRQNAIESNGNDKPF